MLHFFIKCLKHIVMKKDKNTESALTRAELERAYSQGEMYEKLYVDLDSEIKVLEDKISKTPPEDEEKLNAYNENLEIRMAKRDVLKKDLLNILSEEKLLSLKLKEKSKLKTIRARRSSFKEISLIRSRLFPAGTGMNISLLFDQRTLDSINSGFPVTYQKICSLAEFYEVSPFYFINFEDYIEFAENYSSIISNGIKLDNLPNKKIQLRKLSECNNFDDELLQIIRSSKSLFESPTTVRWCFDSTSSDIGFINSIKNDLEEIENFLQNEIKSSHDSRKYPLKKNFLQSERRIATDPTPPNEALNEFSLDNQIEKLKEKESEKKIINLIKGFKSKYKKNLYYGNYNLYGTITCKDVEKELADAGLGNWDIDPQPVSQDVNKVLLIYVTSIPFNEAKYALVNGGVNHIDHLFFSSRAGPGAEVASEYSLEELGYDKENYVGFRYNDERIPFKNWMEKSYEYYDNLGGDND